MGGDAIIWLVGIMLGLTLLGAIFPLLILLLMFWNIDRKFFGTWSRRMTICYCVSLVVVSAPILFDVGTKCATGRLDTSSCAISIITVPPYILLGVVGLTVGIVVVWAVIQAIRKSKDEPKIPL